MLARGEIIYRSRDYRAIGMREKSFDILADDDFSRGNDSSSLCYPFKPRIRA